MIRILFLFLSLFFVSSIDALANEEADAWIWIHGHLKNADQEEEYIKFTHRIFDSYQSSNMMKGRLVSEQDLKALPDKNLVFIGPLAAFEHTEWLDLPIEIIHPAEVKINDTLLKAPRTGIYLRNRDRTCVCYSGLSLAGFMDIFTVPTGLHPCTITCDRGRALYEGEYDEKELILERQAFLDPFPSQSDLDELELPEGGLLCQPVLSEELDSLSPDFRSWLAKFIEGQKVLFVGESHWNTGVNRVFEAIIRDLLYRGVLRSVFLELNFSFSGFYNHYISEIDDAKARLFLEHRLHPMVGSSSTLELLDLLRGWNKAHPDRMVRVACLDMEWSYSNVVRNIIYPYFRLIDENFTISNPYRGNENEVSKLRKRMEEILEEAKDKGIVGEYPFLTPEYMKNVVTNFWHTIDIEDMGQDRQSGIIRNITEFNKELLDDGLSVFKGGGWHAVKRKIESESFYRDAAYLNQVYPLTKDCVVSLQLHGIGYRFANTLSIDLSDHMPSATNYNEFVKGFLSAVADGSVTADAHYRLTSGGLNLFDRLVIKAGYELNLDILRIESIDWEILSQTYGNVDFGYNEQNYDASIFVLRSDIEVMRLKKLPSEDG